MDDLEKSNWTGDGGGFGNLDQNEENQGETSLALGSSTKRKRKENRTMAVKTLLMYRKNLNTLIEESVCLFTSVLIRLIVNASIPRACPNYPKQPLHTSQPALKPRPIRQCASAWYVATKVSTSASNAACSIATLNACGHTMKVARGVLADNPAGCVRYRQNLMKSFGNITAA